MSHEFPIVIVGGGAAGLSAAVEVAEQGKKAIVLEANPRTGGNGMFAEVMFGLNTKEQKRRGIACDLDGYFRLSMEHSHYKNNARLLRQLLRGSAENVDWLCDHGLQVVGLQEEGAPGLGAATHHTQGMHTGRDVMDILRAYCETRENIEIHTRTTANHLILEESGRVCGVLAEENGVEKTFSASAVIIACGGYSGNQELISRINPTVDASAFAHLRGIYMQGSGILMAEEAGGEILTDGCFENAGPTFFGDQTLMGLVTKRHNLWLSKNGRRFVNEGVGDNFVFGCNAVYSQPGHICYVLMDHKMLEEAANGPVDFLAGPMANAKGMAGITDAIVREQAAGRVMYSEDLAAIARWMGADPRVLEAEIAEYNGFCAAGNDPIFLKPQALLKPVQKAPYLCIQCGVDYILTHGGIRVDETMRVQRADGSVVPGLFAAGADISGIDAAGYQVSMAGHSFGFALTGGRIAAKSALHLTSV